MNDVKTAAKPDSAYDKLIERVKQRHLLGSTASLLSWDRETMLPAGGAEQRSKQTAQLARLIHEMTVDPRVGELLVECEADRELLADPISAAAVNMRETRRDYDRATKLPAELVEESARVASIATGQWAEARQANDFKRFLPWLEQNLTLARRRAECYGYPDGGELWDALAEGFEQKMTAAGIEKIFAPLRDALVDLVNRIGDAPRRPRDVFDAIDVDQDAKRDLARQVTEAIGFDYHCGRLDTSAHPFSSTIHPTDVRITTRYREGNALEPLSAAMHEAGHGIYGQNLPIEHEYTPMGEAVSLAVHESQSRMWENQVGRSRAFWRWCLPVLRQCYGSAADGLTVDDVFGGTNVVRPSLIRVEADEVTYNLHIMVRFELERALMNGGLGAADLPGAWNEKYRQYLGVEVPDDARGCMQDVHWSHGAIGYFPTYTLGNLYAAQFFRTAEADLPDLQRMIEAGQFASLKTWLVQNIHRHGMRYRSGELCEHVTRRPLTAEPLLAYLEGKLSPLYGL